MLKFPGVEENAFLKKYVSCLKFLKCLFSETSSQTGLGVLSQKPVMIFHLLSQVEYLFFLSLPLVQQRFSQAEGRAWGPLRAAGLPVGGHLPGLF